MPKESKSTRNREESRGDHQFESLRVYTVNEPAAQCLCRLWSGNT